MKHDLARHANTSCIPRIMAANLYTPAYARNTSVARHVESTACSLTYDNTPTSNICDSVESQISSTTRVGDLAIDHQQVITEAPDVIMHQQLTGPGGSVRSAPLETCKPARNVR